MVEMILLAAVLLDFLWGEPPYRFHPTVWMGSYIKKMWSLRPAYQNHKLFAWGIILCLSGILIFAGIPAVFLSFLGKISIYILIILSIPMLKVSFSLRYLLKSVKEIQQVLHEGQLDDARKLTAFHLVSRDTSKLSEAEILSCVIESLSENITDSFTSPLFYYFLGGVPAALAYRYINTSDAMIAYRKEDYEWGGKFTAWMDSFLNYIPARFTAIMIVLASCLLPGASGGRSFSAMRQFHGNTASPNAGWTMSAMAGGLGVRLQKEGDYILNEEASLPTFSQIDRSLKITVLSLILTVIALITLYRGGLWVLNMVV